MAARCRAKDQGGAAAQHPEASGRPGRSRAWKKDLEATLDMEGAQSPRSFSFSIFTSVLGPKLRRAQASSFWIAWVPTAAERLDKQSSAVERSWSGCLL